MENNSKFFYIIMTFLIIASCNNNGPKNHDKEVGETIKIGNLEIMTSDLGKMEWKAAMKACNSYGEGWHLPTKEELQVLYYLSDSIGNFVSAPYWSSSDYGIISYHGHGTLNFKNGKWEYANQFKECYVRAVKAN